MGMMDIFKGKTEDGEKRTEKAITDFQNPFKKSGVSVISIRIYNMDIFSPGYASIDPGRIDFDASIKFKSGKTSGEHEIKGGNFAELVEKVNAFIKAME